MNCAELQKFKGLTFLCSVSSECEDCFWCCNKGCFKATKAKEKASQQAKIMCFPLNLNQHYSQILSKNCLQINTICYTFYYSFFLHKFHMKLWSISKKRLEVSIMSQTIMLPITERVQFLLYKFILIFFSMASFTHARASLQFSEL